MSIAHQYDEGLLKEVTMHHVESVALCDLAGCNPCSFTFFDGIQRITAYVDYEDVKHLRDKLLELFPAVEPVAEIPVAVPVSLRLTAGERSGLQEALARADREEAEYVSFKEAEADATPA